MKLYWVTTDFHEEDWFVIAPNAKGAAGFHEDAEGYEKGDAAADQTNTQKVNIPAQRTRHWLNPLKWIRFKRVAGNGDRTLQIYGMPADRRKARRYAEWTVCRVHGPHR